ncbi:flagellar export protein FliJ [Oscillospiraceae bacterium MB08-C2-2]|nr:flagellar export protein FliJ [Oscillospiraceae bacterium MB08-C2-2]
MKRFSFSLQRLLRFKEQLMDAERAILAEMNALLFQYRQELEALRADLAARSEEFNQKVSVGMLPSEIAVHKSFIRLIETAIEQKIRQIEMQTQAIDKQTEKVRGLKIEISSMEKLREKRLEEYNYQATKAEETFIEEYVSTSKAMAAN